MRRFGKKLLVAARSLGLSAVLVGTLFSCSNSRVEDERRVKLSDCTDAVCVEKRKEITRIRLSDLEAQGKARANRPGGSGRTQNAPDPTTGEGSGSGNPPPKDDFNPDLNPTPVYIEPWEPRSSSEKIIGQCAICHDWVSNKTETLIRRSDSIYRIESGNMPRGRTLTSEERQILLDAFKAL